MMTTGTAISLAPDGTAVRGLWDLGGLHPIFLAPDLVMWVDDLALEDVNTVATDIVMRSMAVPTETIRGNVVFTGTRAWWVLPANWATFVLTYRGVRQVEP
jgi:hypothetical protein